LGFGGLKSTKSTKKYLQKVPLSYYPYFNSNNPPEDKYTMQHISNAITTSSGVKQSFVISIGTFHEASAIIPVLCGTEEMVIVSTWYNDPMTLVPDSTR
jgi:hypothetical protein